MDTPHALAPGRGQCADRNGRGRTCGLLIRNQVLSPTELRSGFLFLVPPQSPNSASAPPSLRSSARMTRPSARLRLAELCRGDLGCLFESFVFCTEEIGLGVLHRRFLSALKERVFGCSIDDFYLC